MNPHTRTPQQTNSKQLEGLLESEWGAEGKGLHEKLNWVQASPHPLPEDLVRKMRFLASVRNKLIHDPTYNRIDDRKRFINAYQTSKAELKAILRARGSRRATECAVM